MRNLRASIRRFLPVLIGCVMLLSATSGAFAQAQPPPTHEGGWGAGGGGPINAGGSGPGGTCKPGANCHPGPGTGSANLQGLVNTYQTAALSWTTQILNYATNLFWILCGIEFAWAAALLLLEQRELEGWIAAFLKKIMGISFFYALLLNSPNWITWIVDSFSQIGQNVGGINVSGATGITPDTILQQGMTLGVQVISSGASIGTALLSFLNGTFAYVLLIGAIGCVIILCYIILAFTFVMALIEGYIVVSAGLILLGFGGSRWTQSYAERFLGGAVTSGIRMMVIFLLIGLSQSLATGPTQYSWTNLATAVGNAAAGGDNIGAAQQAFFLASSVIIFTALVLGLPKIVGGILNGSAGFGAGDLAGAMGAIGGGVSGAVGGASAVASMAAKPYQMAAKAGGALAHAAGGGGGAGAGGALSHGKTPEASPPKAAASSAAGNNGKAAGGKGDGNNSQQAGKNPSSSAQKSDNGNAVSSNGATGGGVAGGGTGDAPPPYSPSDPAAGGDVPPPSPAGEIDGFSDENDAFSSASGGEPLPSYTPSASAGKVSFGNAADGMSSADAVKVGSGGASSVASGGASSGDASAPAPVSSGSASSSHTSSGHAASSHASPASHARPASAPPASASGSGSQSEGKKQGFLERTASKGGAVQQWGSSMAQAMPSEIDSAPPETKGD